MKNVIIIVLMSLICGSAWAELTVTQQHSLFDQANQAFRAANNASDLENKIASYQQAILAYESLIQQSGIRNYKLYYNLANAYLLKGDVGHAIVNYRRAEQLNDADADLLKNLAFARSRRIDQFDTPTEQRVLETLFFWHYDFGLKTRFILGCLTFAMACFLGIVMIWWRRSSGQYWSLSVVLVLWLCFTGSIILEQHQRQQTQYGVITETSIVARQGDGANYPESFKQPLHAGTEFTLIEQRPNWLHIQLPDETDTWIPSTAASLL